MIEKVEILGVKVDICSVKEAVDQVTGFLSTDSLSTVGMVFSNVLVEALKQPDWAKQAEHLDLTMIGDKEMLKAAGSQDMLSTEDVEENKFLDEVFQYVVDNHRNVALLTEKDVDKIPFQKYMKKKYRGLEIVEVFSMEDATEDEDSIVNMMNAAAEDIIVAAIPSPAQEEFLMNSRQKLGAKVWIGLGQSVTTLEGGESKASFLGKMIEKRIFKRKVSKYQSEKGE